ncbi:hypothetical protein [uncultured Phocaeicola sp.]|uniref:hypothetical protein n=1 Tax=uncultured Phocaeicola sp. TaxID=990718 RepID=UPI00321F9913
MKEREQIMSKMEERESRRRSSVVGSIVDSAPAAASGKKGRPKEDRETKKRVSLSVLPSLYEDIQKIAYVQRRSVSDIMSELMEGYRSENVASISEFEVITKH